MKKSTMIVLAIVLSAWAVAAAIFFWPEDEDKPIANPPGDLIELSTQLDELHDRAAQLAARLLLQSYFEKEEVSLGYEAPDPEKLELAASAIDAHIVLYVSALMDSGSSEKLMQISETHREETAKDCANAEAELKVAIADMKESVSVGAAKNLLDALEISLLRQLEFHPSAMVITIIEDGGEATAILRDGGTLAWLSKAEEGIVANSPELKTFLE